MTDNSQQLQQIVQTAFASKQALAINGYGSKHFYGFETTATEVLDASSHQGIVSYEPNELVLTARAGTPLREIEDCLAEQGQMLSCEAPHFGASSSFGGTIAAGISGPRRPFGGSISDLILGCKIINGQGDILQFGGKVMKNVAGYDNSRLMAGSMGCLGLILEATVKVVPKPKAEQSFHFDIEQEKNTVFVNKLLSMGYPVSASAFDNDLLIVRFSAGEKEISRLENSLHRDFNFIDFEKSSLNNYWHDLRDQRLTFFDDTNDIWRLSIAPNAKSIELVDETIMEWSGAQRWFKTSASSEDVFEAAASANAFATLFRTTNKQAQTSIFQPLSAPLMHWQQELKKAFDPAEILNPGRMYREL
jgi:glycolate oxidase FAD binding subunit